MPAPYVTTGTRSVAPKCSVCGDTTNHARMYRRHDPDTAICFYCIHEYPGHFYMQDGGLNMYSRWNYHYNMEHLFPTVLHWLRQHGIEGVIEEITDEPFHAAFIPISSEDLVMLKLRSNYPSDLEYHIRKYTEKEFIL